MFPWKRTLSLLLAVLLAAFCSLPALAAQEAAPLASGLAEKAPLEPSAEPAEPPVSGTPAEPSEPPVSGMPSEPPVGGAPAEPLEPPVSGTPTEPSEPPVSGMPSEPLEPPVSGTPSEPPVGGTPAEPPVGGTPDAPSGPPVEASELPAEPSEPLVSGTPSEPSTPDVPPEPPAEQKPASSSPLLIEDDEAAQAEAAIQEILDTCIRPGMSDLQKALAVNDYFCVNYRYSMEDGGGAHNYIYMLLRHRGVCQAYSDAYSIVLQRAGVPCYTVSSYDMAHAWNMLRLDGQWYHVDLTWNDRCDEAKDSYGEYREAFGFAGHRYFLCSDSAISKKPCPHYNYPNAPAAASSALYDDAFWVEVDAPILTLGERFYYPLKRPDGKWDILSRPADDLDAAASVVKTVECARKGQTGCVGLAARGGRLYYNDAVSIRSCLPDGGDDRLEAAPTLSDGAFLTRLLLRGTTLVYGVGPDAYCPASAGEWELGPEKPVASIALDKTEQEVFSGEEGALTAFVLPEDADLKTVLWTSDTPSVLEIDETTGRWRAVSEGAALVTAAAQDGGGVTAACSFTVLPRLQSLSVSGPSKLALGGEAVRFSALAKDAQGNSLDLTAKAVWSGDGSLLLVDGSLVSGLEAGEAALRCSVGGKTAEKTIQVVQPVTEITITGLPEALTAGQSARLTAETKPQNAANAAVRWNSSAPSAAAFSGSTVTAKAVTERTTVTLAAEAADGFGALAQVELTILPRADSAELLLDGAPAGSRLLLAAGESKTLSARALPEDAAQKFAWSSSAPSVVRVTTDADGNALLEALKNGAATVTAKALDGSGKKASVTVEAITRAEAMAITGEPLSVSKDCGTLQLRVQAEPAGAFAKDILWTSGAPGDTGRASIDENGKLTAIRDGLVTVTAETLDGSALTARAQVQISGQTSYARLYGPRVGQTALTLNRRKLTGEALTILPRGNDAVLAASLSDEAFCILPDSDADGLYEVALSQGTPSENGRYPVTLTVTTEQDVFTYPLTLTVTDRKPSVSAASGKLNSFYPQRTWPLQVSSSQGACAVVGFADGSELANGLALTEEGALRLLPGVERATLRGKLLVQVEGYAPQPASVSVSVQNTPPKLTPAPSKAVLSKNTAFAAATFFVYDKADQSKTPIRVSEASLAENGKGQPYNAGQLSVSVEENGAVTVTLDPNWLAALTRTANVTARLSVRAEGWSAPVAVALPLTVQATAPSVRLSPSSLRLNRGLAGETARAAFMGAPLNLPVTDAEIAPAASNADEGVSLVFDPERGELLARMTDGAKGGTYRFSVTPLFEGGTAGKPLTLTVRTTAAAPKLTAALRGKALHCMEREGTASCYLLKLSNTVDTIETVTLDAASREAFDAAYDSETGMLTLQMKREAAMAPRQRFSVTLSARLLQSGKTLTQTVSVAPLTALPKVKLDAVAPVFYTGVGEASNRRELRLTASFGKIAAVEPDGALPDGFSARYDPASGRFCATFDGVGITSAGRRTLAFRVFFEGQPQGGAGAVLRVNAEVR